MTGLLRPVVPLRNCRVPKEPRGKHCSSNVGAAYISWAVCILPCSGHVAHHGNHASYQLEQPSLSSHDIRWLGFLRLYHGRSCISPLLRVCASDAEMHGKASGLKMLCVTVAKRLTNVQTGQRSFVTGKSCVTASNAGMAVPRSSRHVCSLRSRVP